MDKIDKLKKIGELKQQQLKLMENLSKYTIELQRIEIKSITNNVLDLSHYNDLDYKAELKQLQTIAMRDVVEYNQGTNYIYYLDIIAEKFETFLNMCKKEKELTNKLEMAMDSMFIVTRPFDSIVTENFFSDLLKTIEIKKSSLIEFIEIIGE